MSEPGEVRVVRCPKCQNLLPELVDYSVYQCGGCGAVLRAKNRNSESDTLSQKSDEERVQGLSDKIPKKPDNLKFSEKVMDLSDGSENDVKSKGSYSRRDDKRKVLSYRTDNQMNGSSIKDNKWVVDSDPVVNENLSESGHEEKGKELEDLKPPNGIPNGSRRTGSIADWRGGEGSVVEGFWRNPEREFHGVRYSTTKYSEDGPSNYHLRSSYGYGEQVKNQNKPDEFNKVEYLEQDKAELLRKLDELKDQISRSCDVKDKPKEKVPLDRRSVRLDEPYSDSEPWFPEGSWGSNRASGQYSVPDPYIARPPYQRHYPELYPNMNRLEMDTHSFHPSMGVPNQVQRYGDPLRSQILRRAPQAPGILQQQPSHPYFSEQYVENDMDPFESYPPNMNFHHPSCSCFNCYNKHPQGPGPGPGPAPPTAFRNKMFPDVPKSMMFYHHEKLSAFGTRDHNSKIANPPPLNSHLPQSHTRWPSDLSSEVGSFVHRRPTRVVQATGGRRCHAIAGGAPFVICYNCFQLLQLPKKILVMEKKQKKVLCGACSTVIPFAVVNKKLVVSAHAETNITPKMLDDSPNAAVSGGTSHSHVNANHAGMNFSSDDYDNSGYDFQSMDREAISSSTGQGVCSSKSAEMRSDHSTSSYSSEDEANPESLNAQRLESNSAELAAKANQSPPPAGSPLQDHFDYSSKYNVVNRFGKGNQSGRSERENEEPKKVTSRQDSMKDASLATEMEVSFNEYSNTGTSQESGDVTREEYQPRVNKGGQSFFAGIIKKSFRDLSRSNHTMEQSSTNVTINGHPIPDRTLRKAEKLAGPVHPGHYWYDFRAGFWGVMGGHCLGIIPPFIEEFNYPMPENCAGGNTAIFVNGRELHPKDLNLLGNRGLPTTRDRSYIIEISGRVLDEDSGEELDSLGKLAPTVEKAKHGFGMKVPRVAT
ncbi:protein ENHANCED DISEASE RESISTANCE 4-like [Actinidia eriantha]|uniref:protein ENHANCED DISEASE RESISTANCE 4-like n=1 Tax=Actinidia eriantha TaxID=165200 RepID=UPI002587FD2B|nr:protein ENHANCED DISEASE RESISTANCE 4-like [Actinidia eriantha]